jgi:hypothetical protein
MRISTRLSYDLLRKAMKRATQKGKTLSSLIEKGAKAGSAKPHLPVSGAYGGLCPKLT